MRSPRQREEPLPETIGETVAAGPLEGVLEGEAKRLLEGALERLSAEQRAVFVLRVFEEMSYQEIAEALTVPVCTVMSRLSRAREHLRVALLPYLGDGRGRAEGTGS
jgi:RNA polymerase sigma-70 factor (ECF subfamily)